MSNLHARLRGRSDPLRMRREVMLRLTAEQAVGLTAFCRQYGLVDVNGAARGVEAVRLLIVVGLTPGANARARATVAARINAKMLVGAMGIRLSTAMGATRGSAETPLFVPRRLRVRLEAWTHTQLSRFAPAYRDGHGKVQDTKIAAEFLLRGMRDPDLGDTALIYARWINPFRSVLARYEEGAMASLEKLSRQWSGAAGLSSAASGG